MKKSEIFWQSYLNLEKEALEVSKYIFFTDEEMDNKNENQEAGTKNSQLETFSPYLADLLVCCCVQIEAISKELYFNNGGPKSRDKKPHFDYDCLKLIDEKWKTHDKTVHVVSPAFNFTKDENRSLKPLNGAHCKRDCSWKTAYQDIKHDRFEHLHEGNVRNFLHALAALYLLNIYYRNDRWSVLRRDISKIDFSIGSALFSVTTPVCPNSFQENIPIKSESPFVVRLKDEDYNHITALRQKANETFIDYWSKQPELQEPDFIQQLQEVKNAGKNLMPFWELGKYRMNKKFPKSLPFEERKKLLIESEDWNSWIHLHNNYIAPDGLTENNIQEEVDKIGEQWGMQFIHDHGHSTWINHALNESLYEIYIP